MFQPRQQFGLIGVRRDFADGVDVGIFGVFFAEYAHLSGAIDNTSRQRTRQRR